MLEIEISYTAGDHEPTFLALVEEFSQQSGIMVRTRKLAWETAWVELFTMASEGKGSDISSIGSTWVSTLAKLDALRPFKLSEIAEIGAENAFITPSWHNTKIVGDQRVWSIPWIGWMYLITYRKDLLESVGIDSSRAFGTAQSTRDTLAALTTSALEIPWLNADYPHPFLDYIHTAASWVWAARGEFTTPTGDKALFDTPEAISGFADWLNTYRSVPRSYQQLTVAECRDLLIQGHAAAAVVDINVAHTLLNAEISSVKPENIGFANLTNTPWIGGGSFVIWEHTRINHERERAAVELVKFLSTKKSHLRWRQRADLLPLRMDALKESYPPGNPLHEAVVLASSQGRSYYNVSLWRRFEARLCMELGAIIKEARENPSADSKTILQAHLEPLAKQMNMLLQK